MVFYIVELVVNKGEFWVGFDDGKFYIMCDEGKNWKDVMLYNKEVQVNVIELSFYV